MVRRVLLALCLVASAAAVAPAQQPETDAKLRQEVEAVFTAWLEALNKGDGKAANAFFVPNAPAINPSGMVHGGTQEYINRVELQHQQNVKTVAKIDRIEAIGRDVAYAIGPWDTTLGAKDETRSYGLWAQVFERHGDGWKISLSSFTRHGPPGGGQSKPK